MSGEGFFLKSPSEFIRFSLSARCVNKPLCLIELKDGARSALLFTSNEATKQEPSANTSLVEAAPAPESAAAPSEAAPSNTDDSAPTANRYRVKCLVSSFLKSDLFVSPLRVGRKFFKQVWLAPSSPHSGFIRSG